MKKIRLLFWIEAAFYLIFWLYLLFRPELAIKTIIMVCWIYALVSWIAWIVFSIRENEYYDRFLLWVISAFSAVFGILLLCFPQIWETIIQIFVTLLWVGIVVKWSFLMSESLNAKKMWVKNWYFVMILWCLLVALWVFIVMNWYLTVKAFSRLIGLCLVGGWIAMLVWSFQVNKFVKDVKKELNNVESVEIEIK
jgi:hypothetical protein